MLQRKLRAHEQLRIACEGALLGACTSRMVDAVAGRNQLKAMHGR
jgi:hypothetical protein